jgi:hypothetical protein
LFSSALIAALECAVAVNFLEHLAGNWPFMWRKYAAPDDFLYDHFIIRGIAPASDQAAKAVRPNTVVSNLVYSGDSPQILDAPGIWLAGYEFGHCSHLFLLSIFKLLGTI